MEPLSIEKLDRLAAELFPSLSTVCLVGRGEPTVADDRLWSALTRHAVRNRVLVSITTNGSLLKRRITEELLPWIDTVEVSIDGATDETMSRNRVGGSWQKLLEGLQHFNDLRSRSNLARVPRLGGQFHRPAKQHRGASHARPRDVAVHAGSLCRSTPVRTL
jgi:MoaA/NifB/PqqE/SkfB family radical SAM enzyme